MGNVFRRADAPSEAAEDWPWIWALREPAALDWKDRCKDVGEIQLVLGQQCLPVEVAPGLLLASAKEARSLATLEAFSVTHVLNAAGPLQRGPVDEYAARGIAFEELGGEDEEGYAMLESHLDAARAFVAKARPDGVVLVHCAAGLNRSGVVVAAERMLSTREDVLSTVAHCRRRRGNMFLCNESFQAQLVALARTSGLLGPEPGHEGSVVPKFPPPKPPLGAPRKLGADALRRLV